MFLYSHTKMQTIQAVHSVNSPILTYFIIRSPNMHRMFNITFSRLGTVEYFIYKNEVFLTGFQTN